MRYFLLFFLALSSRAATYYITVNGNNGNAGTEVSPWRTLQKGFNTAVEGDTVFVGPGDFAEYNTSVANGNSAGTTNRIFFKTNSTNTAATVTRQIRFQHRFITIDGFHFMGTMDTDPQNQNASMVRIEAAATGCVLTNCVFRDTPWLDARFSFATNSNELLITITNSTGNFLTSNFVVGGHVFLGSDSHNYYTNHDRAVRIKAISGDGQTITVTNSAATNFFIEPRQSLWGVIFAGQGNEAYTAILHNIGSGIQGPTNCVISHCNFTNLFGTPFKAWGESYIFEDNYITRLNSWYAIRPFGRNGIVRRNTWYNSPGIIWFSDAELAQIEHPEGGSFFDYNVGAVHSQVTGTTNLLFVQNWIQGFEQQLGVISKQASTDVGGITILSNVFVGVAQHFSQNADWVTNKNNTFYRVAYNSSHAITAGGISSTILQTNIDITSNAFVDCGSIHGASAGWYSTTDTSGSNLVNNFGCGPETTGFQAKMTQSNNPLTFNGGDPRFVNILNPIGPDGLAFTSDDGLRPLPNSILASNGIGALTPISINIGTPIAHFYSRSPTNWTDYVGTNGNPGWLLIDASDRGSVVRPYTTPDPLGSPPIAVDFDASGTIGGLSNATNTYGIQFYGWDFGDGGKVITFLPQVQHTYLRTGQFLVVLSVTNYSGGWNQSSNLYRILPHTNSSVIRWVATSGSDVAAGTFAAPWATIQKAANTVNAGEWVAVSNGVYLETIDCTRSASNSFIRFVGYSVSNGGWNMRKSGYQIEGFTLNFSNNANNGAFYLYKDTTNILIVNNSIGPSTNTLKMGVYFELGVDGLPNSSQQFHTISNNLFNAIDYIQISAYGRGHRFQGNIFREGNGQSDLFRVWGVDSVIADNHGWNMCPIEENHSDIYQIFGHGNGGSTIDLVASNIVIERNVILNSRMQVCQLENYTNPPTYITNIYFRNNIINVNSGANIDADGTKWYNNLLWRSTTNTGMIFVFGGPKGSALGTEIKNNIFYWSGSNPANTGFGWYGWMEAQFITNYSLVADYNMVIGSNYAAKATAPPSADGRWGSTGGEPANTWEQHGINGGNPLFIFDTNYDFRVLISSPTVDRGVTISSFSDDILGNPRVGTWDIGPFNFTSGIGPTSTPGRGKPGKGIGRK